MRPCLIAQVVCWQLSALRLHGVVTCHPEVCASWRLPTSLHSCRLGRPPENGVRADTRRSAVQPTAGRLGALRGRPTAMDMAARQAGRTGAPCAVTRMQPVCGQEIRGLGQLQESELPCVSDVPEDVALHTLCLTHASV